MSRNPFREILSRRKSEEFFIDQKKLGPCILTPDDDLVVVVVSFFLYDLSIYVFVVKTFVAVVYRDRK